MIRIAFASHPPLVLSAALLAVTTACQSVPPVEPPSMLARGVELSEDEATAERLEVALRGFLADLANGAGSDRWVAAAERERNAFYYASLERGATGTTPLVLKSYPLDDATYAITIAFLPDESPPTLIPRIVELEAVPHEATYGFRSPFETRAAQLTSQTLGSVTFHCSGPFDRERAEEFVRFKTDFDVATEASAEPLDYYCFHSLDALLKTYGLVHDSSKCNFLCHDLGFLANDGRRYVTGTGDERYLFGYVREILEHRATDPEAVYGPYANGVAAFYGGYSLSGDSMETLARQLRDELAQNPSFDFLAEFKKGRKSSVQRHFTYYVLCAFVFGEIQRRHGVEAGLEVLESGADGSRFFAHVEERLGVDESGFHELIVDLIQDPTPTTGS